MTKKQQKAPSGKWQMPKPELAEALGLFVLGWAMVEATLEVAINKQLKLRPLESSIVTAGLQFKSRAAILRSLLAREPQKNAKAIDVVKALQSDKDRNDIMHSVIGGSKDVIWFNRRTTGSTFKSKIENYDRKRLLSANLRYGDAVATLWHELKIDEEDYLKFFHTAHSAANKL